MSVLNGGELVITRVKLMASRHANLLRLARALHVTVGIDQMSHRQLARLVWWRIRKERQHNFW